jgi:hypothetical protein
MEMTRRQFIEKLIAAGPIAAAGLWWLAKKASPRRFIRAVRNNNYPGKLRAFEDIFNKNQWSG